jgi:hypothetical protein
MTRRQCGYTAQAQAANPRWDGSPGRRPVGSGLWLAWDDAADAPLGSDGGGVLLIAAEPGARIGVARDSAGGLIAWDMEAGAPWPDARGNPIAIPADRIAAHAAGPAQAGAPRRFSPLELTQALVLEQELTAFAEADEQSLAGGLAGLDALLDEIGDSRHPLFDLMPPYIAAVEEIIPQVAGAARWSRVTERRAAFQILDRFLRLLHTGLDDPTRLGEIVDPARERDAGDPTRVGRTIEDVGDNGDPVQLAFGAHIQQDVSVSAPPFLIRVQESGPQTTDTPGDDVSVEAGYVSNPVISVPSIRADVVADGQRTGPACMRKSPAWQDRRRQRFART